MSDFRWLTRQMVEAFHAESIARFGGADGLRDEGLLESALARPQNLLGYGDPSIHELAASVGFGLVRNHPFVDGNKRTGLLAIRVFLSLNGHMFEPDETSAVDTILGLAAGELNEADLAAWISDHTRPKT